MSVANLFRRFARALRHAPDRLIHNNRRSKARASLTSTGWPGSILFVCHGNICRSPYAAAAFRKAVARRADVEISIASAGFIGPDRPAPIEAMNVAYRHGLDLSAHRSMTLSWKNVQEADLIVVMHPEQERALAREFGRRRGVTVLGDLDPAPITTRAVQDPFGLGEAVFESSYSRIDRCVEALVAVLSAYSYELPKRDAAARFA